ncbi:MAG: DUF349 domain-containing protein [Rikenellaceae bacterium]
MESTDLKNSVQNDEQFDNVETIEVPNVELNSDAVEETAVEIEKNELSNDDLSELKESDDKENDDELLSETISGKTEEEIIQIFTELLAKPYTESLRKEIELLKVSFYKTRKANYDKLKKEYVDINSTEEGFVFEGAENETKFKSLLADYRASRDEELKKAEAEKEANYKEKLQIIEELKELTNSSETMNVTFAAFKELQNRWKESGSVPKSHIKDLWENYHLQVEKFYDFVKINNELRDLDLKKNYEAKVTLCEDAENLLLVDSVINMFQSLQKLHDQWREIGPVSMEFKDQLWERFKSASTKINKLHQDHFDAIRNEQIKNYELKSKLCDEAETILNSEKPTHKDWEDASEKLIEIQKVWKTIGFAPKKENNLVYARFREICDKFFVQKGEYYDNLKNEMENNLKAKTLFCVQAEALSESDDWKASTEQILELQKNWKLIGAVPRKSFDPIWKRFRTACDKFFERKSAHFSSLDSKYEVNLEAKKQIIEKLRVFNIADDANSFETLKAIQKEWTEIGFVPMGQKDAIQKEYRELIDGLFVSLRAQGKDRKINRFKEKVSNFASSGRSMKGERERLTSKIDALKSDIILLENNIGFFAKSKNADAMINDVKAKINKAKEDIVVLKEQIKIIDSQE